MTAVSLKLSVLEIDSVDIICKRAALFRYRRNAGISSLLKFYDTRDFSQIEALSYLTSYEFLINALVQRLLVT